MNRIALKKSLGVASAVAILGVMLTGCGGGGSSATPQTAGSTTTTTTMPGPVNNFTGPTSKMTVSITIPHRAAPSAAIQAKLAKQRAKIFKTLRTIANTSPSASIRSWGAQVVSNASAAARKAAAARTPEYVSSSTYSVEFVLSDQFDDVLVDTPQTCAENMPSTTCTVTITAPVGTNYTASLYLYDSCGYLLSAGSTSGVSVTQGTTAQVNVTLNGVVSLLDVEESGATLPLQEDSTLAQTMSVTVAAYDADTNAITTPGVLMDGTFTQITQYQLSTAATDPINNQSNTPSDLCVSTCPGLSSTTVTVNPDLSVPATTFAFSGTGFEQDESVNATAMTSGPQLVANLYNGGPDGYVTGSANGYVDLPTVPGQLQWVLQSSINPRLSISGGNSTDTDYNLEFPSATNTEVDELSLNETIPGLASNVTISDNGNCVGSVVSSYSPVLGSYPLTTIDASPFFGFTMNSAGATNACLIEAVDDAPTPHYAFLFVYTDSTSLTVQSKIRSNPRINSQSQVRIPK